MGADADGDLDPDTRIRDAVCHVVSRAADRITPRELEKTVSARFGLSKESARNAVRALVREGRLTYTNRWGTSFVEQAFHGPLQVSDRIWLCPAGVRPPKGPCPDRILIRMRPGVAFGLGDHPTTRLAIRAMAEALAGYGPESALDIGTGTGVLAIAAALLGSRRVLALDIDPCARAEAAANIAENQLTDRITVADTSIDRVRGVFSMVSANLRPPTLSRLADRVGALSGAGAVSVLSGFRPAEWPPLERDYRGRGWSPFWRAVENGWMAVACRKGPPGGADALRCTNGRRRARRRPLPPASKSGGPAGDEPARRGPYAPNGLPTK